MPQAKKSKGFETFNDGLLSICEAEERKLIKTKMTGIRFGNRTVGVSRFWNAKTAGNKVDKLLSIPLEITGVNLLEVNDIVILKNGRDCFPEDLASGQYKIVQIQSKFDARPPALYLSLEKLIHPFRDGRNEIGNSNR